MRIKVKNLDHRNVGTIITWQRPPRKGKATRTTSTEILGITHVDDGSSTIIHTPLGDHGMNQDTEVEVQLSKQDMVMTQILSELEYGERGSGGRSAQ